MYIYTHAHKQTNKQTHTPTHTLTAPSAGARLKKTNSSMAVKEKIVDFLYINTPLAARIFVVLLDMLSARTRGNC